MTAEAWIALGFGAVMLILNVGTLAVGYGVLRGTVAALSARVTALEGEMGALQELKVTVAEVKTAMGFLLEQFKDLNAAIRWMREPAGYEQQGHQGAPAAPRRRG